jgi:hypothetical protein
VIVNGEGEGLGLDNLTAYFKIMDIPPGCSESVYVSVTTYRCSPESHTRHELGDIVDLHNWSAHLVCDNSSSIFIPCHGQ